MEQVLASVRAINSGARLIQSSQESPDLNTWGRAPLDHGPSAIADRPTSLPNNVTDRSFVFQERRPFHPGRFHAFLAEPWAGVLRVRGTLWMASRPELVCVLDVAGASRDIKSEGLWWASVPTADRPQTTQFQHYMNAIWHPKFGDRHQNLSFAGVDVDETDLLDRLEACLLTQDELESPDQWASIPDPFEWPQVAS
jgi:G3E family GTPase